MTHFAVICRSGRPIPVTVWGRVIVYEHPVTPRDWALWAMGLPYGHVRFFRRGDCRFRLMPGNWRPDCDTALRSQDRSKHAVITRLDDQDDVPLDTQQHNEVT